jgi:glutamate mutase epsilon subunit
MVQVDKGWLAELLERLAEAIAAVERGNNRAAGNAAFDACTAGVFETGSAPAACDAGPIIPAR